MQTLLLSLSSDFFIAIIFTASNAFRLSPFLFPLFTGHQIVIQVKKSPSRTAPCLVIIFSVLFHATFFILSSSVFFSYFTPMSPVRSFSLIHLLLVTYCDVSFAFLLLTDSYVISSSFFSSYFCCALSFALLRLFIS